MSENTKEKKTQASHQKKKISNRVKAIIFFSLALLIFLILVLPLGKAWGTVRSTFYGIFGLCVFAVVAFMITLAYRFEKNLKDKLLTAKFWCVVASIVLLDSFIHIIYSFFVPIGSFSEGIKLAFSTFWQGVVGAFFGGLFIMALGRIGSLIILAILIFALVLIFSGLTMSDISRPFKNSINKKREKIKIKKSEAEANDGVSDKSSAKQSGKTVKREKRKKKNDEEIEDYIIDIDEYEKEEEEKNIPFDAPIHFFDSLKNEISRQNTENEFKSNGDGSNAEDFDEPDAEEPSEAPAYRYPPLNLLNESENHDVGNISVELKHAGEKLIETLSNFGVSAKVVAITRGPAVTRYELQPAPGVKISQITGLADDIALNLAASGVRIEAPIPNKSAIGIEIPNKTVNVVDIKELIDCNEFKKAKGKLTVALGRDIEGNPICTDLAKMPHVLIAGATGSGKSVCINSMIISLLYKATPDEVKFIMIDPKVVELGNYNGIPHLLVPVVTEASKASGALKWTVQEMERRYRRFAETSVRDLGSYNAYCEKNPEEKKMPQIVIIIDELADLMMAARSEVEDSICRLAQKARAAGMHLVLATQRPSVNVITGVIKANVPSRIAFAVSSQVDSRTILDVSGAEKLLGKGDMLFSPMGISKPKRVQGCFVSDDEIEGVVEFVKKEADTNYSEEIGSEIERLSVVEKHGRSADDHDGDRDALFSQAAEIVINNRETASTTFLQRKLTIGYARAARIMDQLCEFGIIGPPQGSKPREVLVTMEEWLEMKATEDDI